MPRRYALRSLRSLSIASALLGAIVGCAGDLDHPERFDAVLRRLADGGPVNPNPPLLRDSGMPPAGTDAGAADAGGSTEMLPACLTPIFKTTCGTIGCHESGSKTLDLVSAGVTDRLLDQMTTSMLCKGRKYVDGAGGASLLVDKLGQTPPCGARMPLVGMLSAAQRMCITDWVESLGGANIP